MSEQPISGYRKLGDSDVDLINRIKAAERQLGELWREVALANGVDRRWLALGKTHLQEGFMAFVRAVAKPEDVF